MPELQVLGLDNIKHAHERASIERLLGLLGSPLTSWPVYLGFSVDVGAEIDCLLLGRFGAVIGELKHWDYHVQGYMNGRWERQLRPDRWEQISASATPFEQTRKQRSRLADLLKSTAESMRMGLPSDLHKNISAGLVQVPRLQLEFESVGAPWWFQDGLEAFAERVLRNLRRDGPLPDALLTDVVKRLGLVRRPARRAPAVSRTVVASEAIASKAVANTADAPAGTGHRLTFAGPGAGKTRWMAEEINSLLNSSPSAHILALSYTNGACRNLQERFFRLSGSMFGHEPQRVRFLTLHQFARFVAGAEFANRRVLDSDEIRTTFRLACNRTIEDTDISQIERAVNVSDGHSISWKEGWHEAAWRAFVDRLDVICGTTFEHMLLSGLASVRKEKSLLTDIFVDEFQDVNGLQFEILATLKEHGCRIVAIGDSEQAIFAFAGALPDALRRFHSRFAPEAKKFAQNHRSAKAIVELANSVRADDLRQSAERSSQGRVEALVFPTARATARFVARAIDDLTKEGSSLSYRRSDIAVVARTRSELRTFEVALRRQGVPFSEVDPIPFYDRPRVKQLLRALLLSEPDFTVLELALALRATGRTSVADSLAELGGGPWKDVADRSLGKDVRESINGVLGAVRAARASDDNLPAVIRGIHERLVEPMLTLFEREPNRMKLIQMDVESVCRIAESSRLSARQLSRAIIQDNAIAVLPGDEVRLCTVHAAKGREWKVVLVASASASRFPLGPDSDEGEERRVLYVAMTRAAERLVLCRTESEAPSPYLPTNLRWVSADAWT